MDALEDISSLVPDVQAVGSITDAMDVVDALLNLAKKILGPPRVAALFKPYCDLLGKQILAHVEQMNPGEMVIEACVAAVGSLPKLLVGGGMKHLLKSAADILDPKNFEKLGDMIADLVPV